MALPKLNNTPKYDLTIPSTNKKVKFRPYLVKEEKVLLLAAETKDQQAVLSAILETINACVEGEYDINKLTTFDIEYMFVKLRSKSVGEKSEIGIKCSHCDHQNKVAVNIEEIQVDVPKVDFMVPLTSNITVEMRWPSFKSITSNHKILSSNSATEQNLELVLSVIAAIHTTDERIDLKDVSKKEVEEFIDSMTADQFNKIRTFVEQIPKLSHNVNFDCEQCNNHNEVTLEGLQNFF